MLRFLYTTDLHGDTRAYGLLPALCREHGVSILVNGGDMLPKGRSMHAEQAAFLKDTFPRFLDRCADAGIIFYGLFGNDDLRAFHDDWLELTRTRSGVHDLTERWYPLPGGYVVRGNSLVPDYPFGLKDWCVRDTPDAQPVPTRGRPVTSTREGMEVIEDPAAFFASRPARHGSARPCAGAARRSHMRTASTTGFDDQSDHDGHEHAETRAGVAAETLQLEHQLKLDQVEARTQSLFAALRRSLTPERYEAVLTELADLADVWLAAHYRYTPSLADEFARAWRRDESRGIPPGSRTIRDLRGELASRGSSHLRARLSRHAPSR